MEQYVIIDVGTRHLYSTDDNKIILFDDPNIAMQVAVPMNQSLFVNGVQMGGGHWQVMEFIPALYIDCEFINFNEIQKEKRNE